MDSNLAIRYGGRAAGAALAFYVVGRRMSTPGALAVTALGWFAGAFVTDAIVA